MAMTEGNVRWPAKTREMHNHHMDSTRWNDFPFRDDDVVVGTWAKSGTTWTQQILGQLLLDNPDGVSAHAVSPWIEMRLMPWPETLHEVEAQTHRRFLKTHLPVDALTMSPKAKYIYVGRDPRDVVMSMYNHHRAFKPEFYDMINSIPGRVGEPLEPAGDDLRAYWHAWLDGDGAPFWPFWSHVQSWWDVRDLPNVLLVHFADLKADMAGEIRRIADFLGLAPTPERWAKVLERSSFDYMKANADAIVPLAEVAFEGGAKRFINQGANGRWRDVLTEEDLRKGEAIAAASLSPECLAWLSEGRRAAVG
jgi:aryl sulfotransferase